MAQRDEEDEERRRQTKLEEALEVKSLRRIISAYLNYPEAAEEDVKRYERSFKKLPPAHKALLSHLSSKFQRLRECISANSYFIFSMLQAFEPPLDLSQHIDCCEDYPIEEASNRQMFTGEGDACSCHSTSACQSTRLSNSNEVCPEEGNYFIRNSPSEVTSNKEVVVEGHYDSFAGSRTSHLECSKEIERFSNNDANAIDSCGNVCSSTHDWLDPSLQSHVPLVDVDKVRCIIRNIVRDWAAEGHIEREQCYKPILEELDTLFPNRSEDSVLQSSCLFSSRCWTRPAGFGDLMSSSEAAGEWKIYPWIHSNCNSISDSDQLRPVLIPDIHPASAGITKGFSMCGGDFIEVYGDPSQVGIWDAVVTCFFIDTAHNVVEYIEIISRILKDGGVWINLGPLLYHFAEMYGQQDEMSIELSLEDVKKVALHYGFQLEKEKVIETTYTTNPRSMMQNRYFAAFWTMRKK